MKDAHVYLFTNRARTKWRARYIRHNRVDDVASAPTATWCKKWVEHLPGTATWNIVYQPTKSVPHPEVEV